MLKTKKSKFVAITVLTIVGLLFLIPVINTMDYLFGISSNKNQTFDSDVDVTVTINVEYLSYTENLVRYSYEVGFDFAFNSSVTAVNITSIEVVFYRNTEMLGTLRGIYLYGIDPSYVGSFGTRSVLAFGDNLTCQGYVNMSYQLNSNPQNSTVNYNLVYINNVREYEAYNFNLFQGVVFVAYRVSFVILPLIWFFVIHPDFHESSKEEKEKNEEYLKHLESMKPKESEESSSKN